MATFAIREKVGELPNLVGSSASEAIFELDRLPRPAEISVEYAELLKKGLIAGEILYEAVRAAELGESVSLESLKGRFADQFQKRTVENYIWGPFRKVSPYWAAFKYLGHDRRERPFELFPCLPMHLPLFLSTAEQFRCLAEVQHGRQSPRKSVLAENETLRIYTDAILPFVKLGFGAVA